MLANRLNHSLTCGIVGLMKVVGCLRRPCGGCLHLSWLDELMVTMAICASWLSFAYLPHVGLIVSKLSCDD